MIQEGDKFVCIKTLKFNVENEPCYIENFIYFSDYENCITNELGDKYHGWRVPYVDDYFKKIINGKISNKKIYE